MASVSIITRTRDRPIFLKRALRSITSQEYSDWELVVVNDAGSVDAVEEIVGLYSLYRDKIRVIHSSESHGIEAASNLAINSSCADLIVIHDDDDYWSPSFLSRNISIFERERALYGSLAGIVCHTYKVTERFCGNKILIDRVDSYNKWIGEGILPINKLLAHNAFPPISFIFTRDAYISLGGFDETFRVMGDWEFNVRFIFKYDIWVNPEGLAFYHHRSGGGFNNTSIDEHALVSMAYRNSMVRGLALSNGALLSALLAVDASNSNALRIENEIRYGLYTKAWFYKRFSALYAIKNFMRRIVESYWVEAILGRVYK